MSEVVFLASFLSGPRDPGPYVVNTLLWTTKEKRSKYIATLSTMVQRAELKFTSYQVSIGKVPPDTLRDFADTGKPIQSRGSPFGDYRHCPPPVMYAAAELDRLEAQRAEILQP